MHENASFRLLNISDILPNRFQPRIKFEDDSLDELAASINRFGVIEPIVVRPIGNKFEIIAGERRYKASKLASKTTIPSIIVDLSDKDSEELALLENVQRQSLNPIEEAVSYKRILDMGYVTREELSKKIGKPQSVILGKIRLLSLADEVQSFLLNNKISERHAKALLNISDLDEQVEMLHRIVNERLTVKMTNREIRKMLDNRNDETELLFDERGNNMDIDKIMNEAQDINVDSNENKEQAPDLMAGAADGNLVANNNIFNNTEPSKFVNNQTENLNSTANSLDQNTNSGVTFDSMFNSPVLETPKVDDIPSVDNNTVSNVSDSINNEISGIVSEALKNQGGLDQSPMTNVGIPDINVIPEVNNVSTPDMNVMPEANNVSAPDMNIIPEANNVSAPDMNIMPEANNVSAPDMNVMPEVNNVSAPDMNVIPEANNVSAPDMNVMPEANNVSAPDMNVMPETNNVSAPDMNVMPEANNVGIPDVNINNDLGNELLASQNANNEQNNFPAGSPEVNQSVDNNITNFESNQGFVPPILNNEVSSSDVQTVTNDTITNNIPNYAKIVEKLRQCADDIEKMGSFVNLEEVDLGNQYKVIFTFDK